MARKGLGEATPNLVRLIEGAIRKQHLSGKTNAELAQEFGLHINTIVNYRRRLAKAGVDIPRVRGPKRRTTLASLVDNPSKQEDEETLLPFRVDDIKELLDRLPSMKILTAEERMKWLSHLATHAPDQTKVQAMKALDDLQRSEEARSRVDAALPRTTEERMARLREIREAVGSTAWRAVCGCHPFVATEKEEVRADLPAQLAEDDARARGDGDVPAVDPGPGDNGRDDGSGS